MPDLPIRFWEGLPDNLVQYGTDGIIFWRKCAVICENAGFAGFWCDGRLRDWLC
ncbi:MAG: hypothetical protein LCH34_14780 [Firmicutes bacterium]|nr:hypothetical protein [Bacillota bacterium]